MDSRTRWREVAPGSVPAAQQLRGHHVVDSAVAGCCAKAACHFPEWPPSSSRPLVGRIYDATLSTCSIPRNTATRKQYQSLPTDCAQALRTSELALPVHPTQTPKPDGPALRFRSSPLLMPSGDAISDPNPDRSSCRQVTVTWALHGGGRIATVQRAADRLPASCMRSARNCSSFSAGSNGSWRCLVRNEKL